MFDEAAFTNIDTNFLARPVVDPPVTDDAIKATHLQFVDVIIGRDNNGNYISEKRLVLPMENGDVISGFGKQVLVNVLEKQQDRFKRRLGSSSPQSILIVPKEKFTISRNGVNQLKELYLDIYQPLHIDQWIPLTTGYGSQMIAYYIPRTDNDNIAEGDSPLTYEFQGELIDDGSLHTILEISYLGRSVYYELPHEPLNGLRRFLSQCIFGQVLLCQYVRPFIFDGKKCDKVYQLEDAMDVVVKVVYRDFLSCAEHHAQAAGGFLQESPANELRTFRSIATANDPALRNMFLTFIGAALDPCNLYIVTHPVCRNGNLAVVKKRFPSLLRGVPQVVALRWFQRIVSSLCALASLGICHMDLTLENFLMDNFGENDENERVFLADFGMTVQLPFNPSNGQLGLLDFMTDGCGKILYRPPEYEAVGPPVRPVHGPAVDIWMLGVSLLLLLTRNSLVKAKLQKVLVTADEADLHRYIGMLNVLGAGERDARLRNTYPQAYDLLVSMLRRNPLDRITLFNIQRHPWYQGQFAAGL